MIIELAHFAAILALCVQLLQLAIAGLCIIQNSKVLLLGFSIRAAYVSFALFLLSFVLLLYSFGISDFSVALVAAASHSEKPLLYRLASLWGTPQGSLFLWLFFFQGYTVAFARWGNTTPTYLKAYVLTVQNFISVSFLILSLWASNPFMRIVPPALQGQDLNPILQDKAFIFHPPLLYLGYVGLALPFSYAVVALLLRQRLEKWGNDIKPLLLVAWAMLTLGITIGSYWAYYSLGWGGYWAWDPVENTSMMVWLVTTALIHSLFLVYKGQVWPLWTLFLSLLSFLYALLGTFLVRSGLLLSVHSFSLDLARSKVWLLFISLYALGSFGLFSLRALGVRGRRQARLCSFEMFVFFGCFLLFCTSFMLFIALLYPIVTGLFTGRDVAIETSYFSHVCLPFMSALLLFLPFVPSFLQPKASLLSQKGFWLPLISALACVGWHAYTLGGSLYFFAYLGLGVAWFVVFSCVYSLIARLCNRETGEGLSFFMLVGHMAIGVTALGIVYNFSFSQEKEVFLGVGSHVSIAGYDIAFEKATEAYGANFEKTLFHFRVYNKNPLFKGNKRDLGQTERLNAEQRFYPLQKVQVTRVGLLSQGLSQLYVVPGIFTSKGLQVQVLWKDHVILIWLGGLLMFVGALWHALAILTRSKR